MVPRCESIKQLRNDSRRAPLEERPQGVVQHALELVEEAMLRRLEGNLDDGRPWPPVLRYGGKVVIHWHHCASFGNGMGVVARRGLVVTLPSLAVWGRAREEAQPRRLAIRRLGEPGHRPGPPIFEQAPVSRGQLPGALATLLRAVVAAASSGWRRRPHRALPSVARSRVSEEVRLNRTRHGCDSTKREGGSCE